MPLWHLLTQGVREMDHSLHETSVIHISHADALTGHLI